jgi:hypothetical protein
MFGMFGISLVIFLVTQFRLNGVYFRDGNLFRDNTADGLGVMSIRQRARSDASCGVRPV